MKRWLKYVKPYKRYFILGPLCMIVEIVGEIFMPFGMSRIINEVTTDKSIVYIIAISFFMIVCALLMMAGGVGGAYFGAKAAVNFATDLRSDVYAKIQSFSFSNIDKFSTGSLITRTTNDITQLQNFVNMLLRMFLRAPGMMIGAIIMAILLQPRLAAVLAISIPTMLVIQVIVIRKAFPLFKNMQKMLDKLNAVIQENLTNIRVVKSFVREEHETEKFRTANVELKSAGLKAIYVMIFLMPMMMLFMNLSIVAVLWFGGNFVAVGGMPIGDLSAFITYITQILMSLMMVSMLFMTSSRALASGKRVLEILDEPSDLTDELASKKDKKIEHGKIEFQNVSFKYYKNSEREVLENINIVIPAGKTVGIIGSTGCGKSTLVSLIPRLYDADSGVVKVDDVDVKEYSLKNLRDGIGMVLQKNLLFSGSVSENLRWGDEDATDEMIESASKQAQAHDFVSAFVGGYDASIEQGGSNVSGGQKQRLCIARALLKNPKILILDDSTSAVDTATEAKIRDVFKNELKNSTRIIIAQRISSVKDADQIIVMDDGVITGIGTHDELKKNNPEYIEIYTSQMENEKEQGVS